MDHGDYIASRHLLSGGEIIMSDLRIKSNEDNGDLSKQLELFDDEDNEMNWLKESFNPALLRKKFEKINGHTNKEKDKQ